MLNWVGNFSMEIKQMQKEIVEWADQHHPDRLPENAFNKMLEEIEEWKTRPCDGHEAADVMIILLDVCHLAGIDIEKAVKWKMRINNQREWEIDHDNKLKHTGHTSSTGHQEMDYSKNGPESEFSRTHI